MKVNLKLCGVVAIFFLVDHLLDAPLITLLILVCVCGIYCLRCESSVRMANKILVAWISFTWLYRLFNVGISYLPGGIIEDVQALSLNPFIDVFFPRLLARPDCYAWTHLFIPLLGFAAIVLDHPKFVTFFAAVALALSLLMMISQYGVGNQGATTTFWTSFLLLTRYRDDTEPYRSAVLGQLVVSFIFFGAFVGKLTSEYWTSMVPRQLGQADAVLGVVPTGIAAIFGEGAASFSFLVRPDLAAICCLVVICGMFFAVAPGVVDATGPLVGVCMSSLILSR